MSSGPPCDLSERPPGQWAPVRWRRYLPSAKLEMVNGGPLCAFDEANRPTAVVVYSEVLYPKGDLIGKLFVISLEVCAVCSWEIDSSHPLSIALTQHGWAPCIQWSASYMGDGHSRRHIHLEYEHRSFHPSVGGFMGLEISGAVIGHRRIEWISRSIGCDPVIPVIKTWRTTGPRCTRRRCSASEPYLMLINDVMFATKDGMERTRDRMRCSF